MDESTVFYGYGHKNIVARHRTTLEFTKDNSLTLSGDCILLVSATMSASEIPDKIKSLVRKKNSVLTFQIEVNGLEDRIQAFGDHNLNLWDDRCMVVRKSGYVSPRTVAVYSNKAAIDIDRQIVDLLKTGAKARVTISAKPV
jgi:hypothetical protein